MSKRNFGASFREVDRQFEAALSPAADARLQRALLERKKPVPTRWVWAAAVPVAVCAAIFLLWYAPTPTPPLMAGGLEITKLSGDLRYLEATDGTVTIESGSALLRHPSFEGVAEINSRASFRRDGDALRVVDGRAHFVVEKRGAKGPVRILVSHGAIEIVGTQFTVYQGPDGGRVELTVGSIRFVPLDGSSHLLQPGQVLRWPEDLARAPERIEPVIPEAPAPIARVPDVIRTQRPRQQEIAPTPKPIRSLEEEQIDSAALLQKIGIMRSRAQFGDAAATLEASLHAGYRPVTCERLSYELGSIYTRQLADSAKACAHWRSHAVTYPSGRYDQEVTAAQAELGCPAVP